MKKKAVKLMSILLAAALLVCASVGGTLAWLSAKSDTVVNTFTIGNINITLKETGASEEVADSGIFTKSMKMIPGSDIPKDPKVTVVANSEDCYLFVKITEGDTTEKFITNTTDKDDNGGTYITYDIASGWTELEDGVYYRTVSANAENDQPFYVLKAGAEEKGLQNGYVHVEDTVTKAMMENAANVGKLSLTFNAYAVQQTGFANAAAAWAEVENQFNP